MQQILVKNVMEDMVRGARKDIINNNEQYFLKNNQKKAQPEG